MKTRYVLVNEADKALFEKKWQLPYGYQDCPISTNPNEAGQWLDNIVGLGENPNDWIVEKIDEYGNKEIFYQK